MGISGLVVPVISQLMALQFAPVGARTARWIEPVVVVAFASVTCT